MPPPPEGPDPLLIIRATPQQVQDIRVCFVQPAGGGVDPEEERAAPSAPAHVAGGCTVLRGPGQGARRWVCGEGRDMRGPGQGLGKNMNSTGHPPMYPKTPLGPETQDQARP